MCIYIYYLCLFPNIYEMILLMASTPVISCEHLFSRLRIIHTYLRSTMSEDRLNGLSLLYIHKDI